ncbi:CD200 receptor 1 like [Homo sapiens]|uniref:CD200 receptor 1 like n=1 Tax=Homo sapiens TaxID=9606 RepID=F8WDF0_HUMAN|nr:CD200 receptor 1 like [Homo sapiens]KAI4030934.1 CD200 receptor 1 like [Homo sapiens]
MSAPRLLISIIIMVSGCTGSMAEEASKNLQSWWKCEGEASMSSNGQQKPQIIIPV